MKTFLIRRRALSLAACAAAVCLMFYVINYPAAVDASASQRQLPIYCVQRTRSWPPSASTRPGVMLKSVRRNALLPLFV